MDAQVESEATSEADDVFGSISSKMEHYVGVVDSACGKHISDVLADEGLLPQKFRDSALRAEHLAISQKISPESFAVIIFDSVTMDVDPWDSIQLRGWENGQPSPQQMEDLGMAADELAKEIARQIQSDRERVKDS
jgi:hypothetical protein